MDFGALPPEISSALIYTGPGSAPMVAAAAAWNGLAAELNSAALALETVTTQLTGEGWLGPASASMADAVTPYLTWMSSTAARAEQFASQAAAAAAAYENARAAMVPPQLVELNRAELAQLLATNAFGQNTNAIAALEAQYGEMWAQDAATMYRYAGSSSTATAAVTPFAAPPQVVNPAASALQAASVTDAVGTATGSAQQSLLDLLGDLQAQLTNLVGPSNAALWGLTPTTPLTSAGVTFNPNSVIGSMLTGIGGNSTLNPAWAITAFRNFAGPAYNIEGLPYFSTGMANTLLSLGKGLAPAAASTAAAAPHAAEAVGGILGSGGAGVSASMGQATVLGKLSVPPAIAGIGPAIGHAAPLPVSTISAAPDAAAGNLLGGLPLAGAGGASAAGPRYGFRPTVMARPPFAG